MPTGSSRNRLQSWGKQRSVWLLAIAERKKNVGAFIQEVATYERDGIDRGVDIALGFLKVMEYDLPLRLAALEAVIKIVGQIPEIR